MLNEPAEEIKIDKSNNESNKESQPWDLNNWGINTQSLNEVTPKGGSNYYIKNDKGDKANDHGRQRT